ncbi:HNH endonuclease signature motif containing protein [Streptomyces ziwulingensis]|uniref:HNH endonuclease n=1 Tax=Streptomyces ziwulingensis TaxID=1045501 RepID=A0ABP9D2S5_9ACTN
MDPYDRERLTRAVAEAHNWTDLMRRLGLKVSGGRRRTLQEKVAEHGLDTSHFVTRGPWHKYPDAAIALAAASSSSLREVALKLGATPATGTLSHIRRRIAAAGIDIGHFPGIDTSHFSYRRIRLPEDRLRALVPRCTSYADVMRGLGLEVNDVNHRRVRREAARLGVATDHFERRAWGRAERPAPAPCAHRVLTVLAPHPGRTDRTRLHRALTEVGVAYACADCGNDGAWRGRPITLQIDHINGDWRDNRRDNLRYLCPNCHAVTETWCRRRKKAPLAE